MQRFVPIAGTWARSRHDHAHAWYRTGSPFDRRMIRHGYQRVEQDLDPTTPDRGFWSGAVNGLLVQRLAWWRDHHPAWRTGGETLRQFLRVRLHELGAAGGVTIVAHSHGGQVLAYALAALAEHTRAALGPIHVVTVDMPVRRDMGAIYAPARAACASWTHCYSERGWQSRFRWLGNRFGDRALAVADQNLEVTGGHSGCLSDPRHMDQWDAILPALAAAA